MRPSILRYNFMKITRFFDLWKIEFPNFPSPPSPFSLFVGKGGGHDYGKSRVVHGFRTEDCDFWISNYVVAECFPVWSSARETLSHARVSTSKNSIMEFPWTLQHQATDPVQNSRNHHHHHHEDSGINQAGTRRLLPVSGKLTRGISLNWKKKLNFEILKREIPLHWDVIIL